MGITIGLAVLMLALLIGLWGVRLRHRAGLPWAPVIYQDTGGHAPEKPLIARRLGLVGKPDYLLDIRGRFVPVEIKPGRRADRPYESDLMQLAAYCVLVEETSGEAPPYGLLRYAERTFRLDYTEQTRADLLAILDEMREALADVDCERSHDDQRRCAGCGFYEQCADALEADAARA
jgi:CRISPR-associated exonuclease Cas4